ncbi:hypothetical protein MRX96_000388 [Rhipicephalus microplus]
MPMAICGEMAMRRIFLDEAIIYARKGAGATDNVGPSLKAGFVLEELRRGHTWTALSWLRYRGSQLYRKKAVHLRRRLVVAGSARSKDGDSGRGVLAPFRAIYGSLGRSSSRLARDIHSSSIAEVG